MTDLTPTQPGAEPEHILTDKPAWWQRLIWTVIGDPVALNTARDVISSAAAIVTGLALLVGACVGFVWLMNNHGLQLAAGIALLVGAGLFALYDLAAWRLGRWEFPRTVTFNDKGEPFGSFPEPDSVPGPEQVADLAKTWHRVATKAGIVEPLAIEIDYDLSSYGSAMLRRHRLSKAWLALAANLPICSPGTVRWLLAHEAAHVIAGDHLRGRVLQLILDTFGPAVAYTIAISSGLALVTNQPAWVQLGGAVLAVLLTARLVAGLWSREREHAADAIASHVLDQPLTPGLIAETYERFAPGSRMPWATHPTFAQRLDHLDDIRTSIGLPPIAPHGHDLRF